MSPPRDPELMRRHILQVAAEEMRVNGYKAASLANILDKAGVSKGGLYHHFANKQELGYAVFDEVFVIEFLDDWIVPMASDKPLDTLCEGLREFCEQATQEDLEIGCPVFNIATEMCGTDEGIRTKTLAMFKTLQGHLATTIAQAKEVGQVKTEVDAGPVATFIVAAIQGSMMQGKYDHDLEAFKATMTCLANYIASLRV